jgi:hypothetical protein
VLFYMLFYSKYQRKKNISYCIRNLFGQRIYSVNG